MKNIWTKVLALALAVAPSGAAQSTPQIKSRPVELTVSVHNYVDLSEKALARATADAAELFAEAEVKTLWLACGPKVESSESKDCYRVDETHLAVKIVAHAPKQVRSRRELLGAAMVDEMGRGYYALVYLDHVLELQEEEGLGDRLLGHVMAHELGHLLLGSNSHAPSGLMCAHWNARELRGIGEGKMNFGDTQRTIIRQRLQTREAVNIEVAEPITMLALESVN